MFHEIYLREESRGRFQECHQTGEFILNKNKFLGLSFVQIHHLFGNVPMLLPLLMMSFGTAGIGER